MGTHHNVIELNGRVYDASTGRMLGGGHHAPTKGAVLDGFIRKTSPAVVQPTATPAPKPVEHVAAHPPKPAPAAHKAHHRAPDAKRHKQHSKTLMRKVVKKPTLGTASAPLSEASTPSLQPRVTTQARLRRTGDVEKSSLISRFTPAKLTTVTKKVQPLDVAQPPRHAEHHKAHHATPVHHVTAHHAQETAQTHFNRAMAHAHAHEETAPKATKKHRKHISHHLGIQKKTFNIAASALAAILLVGFFAYQNIPNISMRIASTKAGFSAKLPSYKPAGFALGGPIQYSPGAVTVSFKSNSDDRNFHLSQKVSNWNSESLLDNFLVANKKTYQTYQDKGRTIYIYDGANATWVNGGVWYQIEGNSSLNNDQLLQIANSI